MSIGRIELIDGQKQFKQYDSGGGGKKNSNSQYMYIEKFVKTEVLLNNYPLLDKEYVNVYAKKYDFDTGEYLGNTSADSDKLRCTPLSFCMIPFSDILGTLYPDTKRIVGIDFFSYIGIGVEMSSGEFRFKNQKKLSENPFFTWYKTYSGSTNLTVSGLKENYPAMLFRGLLLELKTDNLMYIKGGTKKLENADEYI